MKEEEEEDADRHDNRRMPARDSELAEDCATISKQGDRMSRPNSA
jgi:hypothetical protein